NRPGQFAILSTVPTTEFAPIARLSPRGEQVHAGAPDGHPLLQHTQSFLQQSCGRKVVKRGIAIMNMLQPTSVGQGPAPNEIGFGAYQEVWQILRRRKGRILLVLLLGFALATLYCAVSGPWYDSSAQLLVIKKRLDTTPITGPDQVRV